jgi:hypothetical protein
MGIVNRVAASLAAVAMLAPVPAAANALSDAEKIRRLDIMLMVTGLRCRTTADNFQADYGRFTTNHIGTLNAASATMKAQLAKRYGPGKANRALDKVSVTMANQYGNGHPWLSCGQLKMVAKNLATAKGPAPLVAAADQLLAERGSAQVAWAR